MGFCSITFVYALILLLGSFSFGYVVSYPSPAIPEIKEIMDLKEVESTMFNAVSSLFAIFGSLLATFLINIAGKKLTTFMTAVVGLIFWISLSFMTLANIWLGISGRAVLGIFMGSISVVIPLCINELTPPEYKGIYGSLSQFGISTGCTAAYFLATLLDWRGLTYFDGALCGALCLLIWIIPLKPKESNENNNEEKESVFQRKHMRNLFVGIGAMFFQQFSGINAILTNLNTLFDKAGLSLSPSIASGIASSAQVIAVIIGSIMIQFFGRRCVWIFSEIGAAVFILIYGLTIKFPDWPSWIAIIAIFAYLLTFGVGLGPIPWFIVPQLFQGPVSSSATSIATAVNWTCAFTVILCFPYLNNLIGDFYSMILFMIVCVFGIFFGWFFVGEREVFDENELANSLLAENSEQHHNYINENQPKVEMY